MMLEKLENNEIGSLSHITCKKSTKKCQLKMNGLKKMYTYTMEYYLATRKEGSLPFPTTWMDLENIMLRDISHTERQIL